MKESAFLYHSFLLGFFITFFYDFFVILRKVFPHKGFWISVEDLIFWTYTCISVFLLMQKQGDGNLRWFAVFGSFAGMVLYKKTVSSIYKKIGTRLLFWIILPIKKLGLFIRAVLRKLRRFLGSKVKKAGITVGKKRKQAIFSMKKKLTFFFRMLRMTI